MQLRERIARGLFGPRGGGRVRRSNSMIDEAVGRPGVKVGQLICS